MISYFHIICEYNHTSIRLLYLELRKWESEPESELTMLKKEEIVQFRINNLTSLEICQSSSIRRYDTIRCRTQYEMGTDRGNKCGFVLRRQELGIKSGIHGPAPLSLSSFFVLLPSSHFVFDFDFGPFLENKEAQAYRPSSQIVYI